MNILNLYSKSTHRPCLGVVSRLQIVLSPKDGARHAHGKVHSAGGILKIQGEGGEAVQGCVYTTQTPYILTGTQWRGSLTTTPDIQLCLAGTLV